MKLNIKATALASGILWGMGLLFLVLWTMFMNTPSDIIIFLSNYYIGLNISLLGSLIGFFWAFLDGAFAGALFAWLYNKFVS